jgi:hypothetical protein
MSKWIGLGVVGAVILLAIIAIVWYFGIVNGEVRLSTRYDAQFNVRETTLDKMRKTLMNQYGVTRESADKVIAAIAAQTEGRKGGSLFKSVTESPVSGMPLDMYKAMFASIEGNLAEYKRAQDTLTDVWREHATYCQVAPNSWFVSGKLKPKPEMISSDAVKSAIATGKLEDDVLTPGSTK